MDDIELITLLVFLAITTISMVAIVVHHEARQKKRKPNIRVPRETLWGRTNRYHRSKT